MTTLADLNALPPHAAEPLFGACCGAPGWVQAMLARRPFASVESLLAASDEVSATLAPAQWLAAFAHHPRIGEQRAAAPVSGTAQSWSEAEQGAAASGDDALRDELREAQRLYEQRFGYIFIICASGRPAREILDALRARMRNSPDAELRVAAEEQRKITRLRLEKLVSPHRERSI